MEESKSLRQRRLLESILAKHSSESPVSAAATDLDVLKGREAGRTPLASPIRVAKSPAFGSTLPPVSPPPAVAAKRPRVVGGSPPKSLSASPSQSSVSAYDAVIKGLAAGTLDNSVSPTVYSRDISSLLDRPSRAWDGASVPETLIPEAYHVYETATKVPPKSDATEWTKEGYRRYVRRLFPKMKPTGRQQAIMLEVALKRMIDDKKQDVSDREAVIITQGIMSTVFHEVTRQVSVSCQERGRVLFGVWMAYADVFAGLRNTTDAEVDAAQAHVQAMQETFTTKSHDWEEERQGLLDEIERLKQRPSEEEQEAAIAKVRQEAKIEFEHLLQAARAGFRADMEAARASDDAIIRSLNEQIAELKKLLGDRDMKMKILQAELAAARNMPMPSTAPSSLPAPPPFMPAETKDTGMQTEPLEEPEVMEVTSKRKRRVRKAPPVKPFERKQAFRIMASAYVDKIRADRVEDYGPGRRVDLKAFLNNWFNQRYGVTQLASKSMARLKQSVAAFKDTCAYINMFGFMWGLTGDMASDEEILFFDLMAGAFGASKAQKSRWDYDAMCLRVPVACAMTACRSIFGTLLDTKAMVTFLTDVQHKAVPYGRQRVPTINWDVLIDMVLVKYRDVKVSKQAELEEQYSAATTGKGGVLSVSEFSDVVKAMLPSVSQASASDMYHTSMNESTRGSIAPSIVAKLLVARGHLLPPRADTPINDREEDLGGSADADFSLLEMAWGDAQTEIIPLVKLVTNPAARKFMEGQLDIVQEAVETRTNGDLAWLALRMVSAEVTREGFKGHAMQMAVGTVLRIRFWYKRIKNMRLARMAAAGGGVAILEAEVMGDMGDMGE